MVGWYDYGLGEWVEDNEDRKKKAKRKGLIEVGSLEEAYSGVRKQKDTTEEDFKAMIVDSMNRYKYDKYAQWKVRQGDKIARWKQMIEDYNRGIYTISAKP
jgi:hypothetical protein